MFAMKHAAVDQSARRKAALLIRRWLEGSITNFEIDDSWPWECKDDGVVDIGKETWRYYDDFPEQTLSLKLLSGEEIHVLRRCLRFLESKEEYLVPEGGVQGAHSSRDLLSRLFGAKRRIVVAVDDQRKKWWPFADETQYSKAIACSGLREQESL
jgi:hypothetical protein